MARTTVRLKGLKATLRKIEGFEELTNHRIKLGLNAAGKFVKEESLKLTPYDTGNLHAAAYGGKKTPVVKTPTGMYTTVGYSKMIAPYAMAVHEAPGTWLGLGRKRSKKRGKGGVGNLWDFTGQPKFLTKALHRNALVVRAIIKAVSGL